MSDFALIMETVGHFKTMMAVRGITVTGFEVASDRDERILAASVPQNMIMPIGLSAEHPRTVVNGLTVTVKRGAR